MAMRSSFLLVLVGCATLALAMSGESAGVVSYDAHVVLRLQLDEAAPLTPDQITAYGNLRSNWNLDWWSGSDVRVAPERVADVRRFMNEHNLVHTVMIEDVQKLINREGVYHSEVKAEIAAGNLSVRLGVDGKAIPDFFKDYHNLADLWAYVDSLVTAYPALATKKQIGTSFEGRPLYVVVVNANKGATNGIYYEGGIHSREWVAHTSVIFVLYSLLSGYGTNPNVTALVNSFNFHINPAVNPDGYVYTWTKDRMWRKTRQPNRGSTCIGTDPNRNWDNHWCEQGASRDPCSDSFCGPNAFSEPETKAAADYVTSVGNIKSFIDFHAYSQLWMQPYGWTAAHPRDYDDQRKAGLDAVAAIKAAHGQIYREGSIYTIIYPASGSSADWAYDTAKVTYPYGVELRDTGTYGFLLPAVQIIPTGEEILAATFALGAYIKNH